MCGSQCSVSGRRSLCHRHRGAERLLVWWYTGAADWFRQYLDIKHRSLPRSHSMLAIITQLQLPSFNHSTRFSRARKLTDNFFWFSGAACCVRYIALSLMTPGAVWSSAVRLMYPRSSFVSWCFPSSLPTATVTFNFEGVFLSSGSRGKEKKKTHVQLPMILQFCSVRRMELQAETQQMRHLTEHRERTNLIATMPTCTLNLHLTGTNTH